MKEVYVVSLRWSFREFHSGNLISFPSGGRLDRFPQGVVYIVSLLWNPADRWLKAGRFGDSEKKQTTEGIAPLRGPRKSYRYYGNCPSQGSRKIGEGNTDGSASSRCGGASCRIFPFWLPVDHLGEDTTTTFFFFPFAASLYNLHVRSLFLFPAFILFGGIVTTSLSASLSSHFPFHSLPFPSLPFSFSSLSYLPRLNFLVLVLVLEH